MMSFHQLNHCYRIWPVVKICWQMRISTKDLRIFSNWIWKSYKNKSSISNAVISVCSFSPSNRKTQTIIFNGAIFPKHIALRRGKTIMCSIFWWRSQECPYRDRRGNLHMRFIVRADRRAMSVNTKHNMLKNECQSMKEKKKGKELINSKKTIYFWSTKTRNCLEM